jgi:hypothetical protein
MAPHSPAQDTRILPRLFSEDPQIRAIRDNTLQHRERDLDLPEFRCRVSKHRGKQEPHAAAREDVLRKRKDLASFFNFTNPFMNEFGIFFAEDRIHSIANGCSQRALTTGGANVDQSEFFDPSAA